LKKRNPRNRLYMCNVENPQHNTNTNTSTSVDGALKIQNMISPGVGGPAPRAYPLMAAWEHMILMFGGQTSGGVAMNDVWLLNPAGAVGKGPNSAEWIPLGDAPFVSARACKATKGDYMYSKTFNERGEYLYCDNFEY
jgi:hypothetical protein